MVHSIRKYCFSSKLCLQSEMIYDELFDDERLHNISWIYFLNFQQHLHYKQIKKFEKWGVLQLSNLL